MERTVGMIVPVHNGAPYLERCMESLLGQTYRHTEILLIDDGSTDDSGRICDAYADRYGKVRVFHVPGGGVSRARNMGMDECRCEYLTFVDVDDVLAEDMVEHLVRLMEETAADVAGCGYFEYHGQEEWKGKGAADRERETGFGEPVSLEIGSQDLQIEAMDGSGFVENGILRSDTRCWSKLYRRESVGSLRFEEGLTIGEDMLFLLELAMRGKRFARSSYRGYGYYVNESGAMLQEFRDSYMDQIVCWQRALEKIGRERPELTGRTEAILLISTMLVVGKLAVLPGKKRREKARYAKQCRTLVGQYGRKKEALRELDRGYRIKTGVYRLAPDVYLTLYHWLRLIKDRRRIG